MRCRILLIAGLVLVAACDRGEPAAVPDERDVAAAAVAAGCQTVEHEPDGQPVHYAPDAAPPAEDLYTQRPPASGPHFTSWLQVDIYGGPVDERAAVHNLEHGAVVVWYDPGTVDEADLAALIAWAEQRNAAGLVSRRAGTGIIVAPYDGAEMPQPLAFRAWQVTGDCDRFERDYADGFVLRYFGSRGHAPEGGLAPDVARAYRR